ncbi:pyridoxal phosphate-dependent decarboxylase family protein [Halobacillus naozhouensis]|uniref:Aspartate aminotransferase family protein n=1 Tax=Halobacillus naozhouensis TaxID=554880 RepID=A0ABY8IWV4_9BACI|nr:aspartate aminotransferase family protein [Halobacillus naozhouensis]WFT73689.1 aspartate aminotransferase family protein [Halobacillus naozhouensis]
MHSLQVMKGDETAYNAFDDLFFHRGAEGLKAYEEIVQHVSTKLTEVFSDFDQPYKGGRPDEVRKAISGMVMATRQGETLRDLLEEIDVPFLRNNLHVSHEKSVAHLHCPPLLSGIAAEMIISSYNQSMDSWDQSTAATYVEREMIAWLTQRFGLSEISDGVFSSGGSQSNYMGLLLARDSFCEKHWGCNVQQEGLPSAFKRMKILCSEDAHFTVQKSASQLGLGAEAVVTVETDHNHRLSIYDCHEKIEMLRKEGSLPFALVGTCGTTDFGSIDPLEELAEVAGENGLWFHVDAAFGGALILSRTHAHKLNGIQSADSITVDFHKLFYQPISCGAFLVNDGRSFQYTNYHADYLNPEADEEEGITNLVNKSVVTTRRFDAFKLFVSLRTVGTDRFAEMIDHTFVVANQSAQLLEDLDHFHVLNQTPELNTIVFRFQPRGIARKEINELNRSIQQQLFEQGMAAIAKTKVQEDIYLKFTLLNPRTEIQDIDAILKDIEVLGFNEIKTRRITQ